MAAEAPTAVPDASPETGTRLATPEEIIEEARNGRMFILVDDEDRENEGDFVIPAQMATPDAVNFMARHGRGLICLALAGERVAELGLEPMSARNGTVYETAFTVSIEAREGVTTGISAADRARTIGVAINAEKGADDIVTPGHVFPLAARDGGVLVRAGHTEAAVDVSRLAGLNPSGVICEIMCEDGTMARLPELIEVAQRHDLKIGTIRDLIAYRRRYDHLVERREEMTFVSKWGGEWRAITFRNTINDTEIVALVKGDIASGGPVPVRMHLQMPFADQFGEVGEESGLIEKAMRAIGDQGRGVVVLLRSPAPDIATCVIRARRDGRDRTAGETVEVREYGIGAQVLSDLGVNEVVLLSNRSHHLVALSGYGISIAGELALP